MATNEAPEVDWTSVIGRALAYLALDRAGLTDETLLAQSEFLERFGITRREAARILGTSDDSLRVLAKRKQDASKRDAGKKRTKGS